MTAGTPPGNRPDAIFIGRTNVDLTVRVPYRAGPSQTVFASPLVTTAGGKSLNQAIALARLGGGACLVANAGDDHWGHLLKTALVDAGVDVAHLQLLPGTTTGAAIIEITPDGENYLVLAISPATELRPDHVDAALARTAAPVVTVQLDIPPEPVVTALSRSPARTVRIGNLVPHPALDRDLMKCLDVFVINQHEAASILGVADLDPLTAAQQLRQLGPAAVVVTAGAGGAAYSHPAGSDSIAAATVPVVDTTGAGDAFLGSLALDLSRDVWLHDAVAHAVQVGTEAVRYQGAHPPAKHSQDGPC